MVLNLEKSRRRTELMFSREAMSSRVSDWSVEMNREPKNLNSLLKRNKKKKVEVRHGRGSPVAFFWGIHNIVVDGADTETKAKLLQDR